MNWSEQFTRATVQNEMEHLRQIFLTHFGNNGYIHRPSTPTINASKYDKSTRFIGSHITILKPEILNATVPRKGVYIHQTGFYTKNLKAFNDSNQSIDRTSVFEGQGVVAHYSDLKRVIEDVVSYFKSLSIEKDVIYQIHNDDTDLIEAISEVNSNLTLEIGTLPREKTIHKYGDDRLLGRDIRIEINGPKGRIASAVIIAVSVDNTPKYVEVTLAPARILEQAYNLQHPLDTFPFLDENKREGQETAWRKMEDILIGVTHLTQEGLKPGGSGNQRQLLKKYFNCLSSTCIELDISRNELECLSLFHEKARYGDTKNTQQILEFTK